MYPVSYWKSYTLASFILPERQDSVSVFSTSTLFKTQTQPNLQYVHVKIYSQEEKAFYLSTVELVGGNKLITRQNCTFWKDHNFHLYLL